MLDMQLIQNKQTLLNNISYECLENNHKNYITNVNYQLVNLSQSPKALEMAKLEINNYYTSLLDTLNYFIMQIFKGKSYTLLNKEVRVQLINIIKNHVNTFNNSHETKLLTITQLEYNLINKKYSLGQLWDLFDKIRHNILDI